MTKAEPPTESAGGSDSEFESMPEPADDTLPLLRRWHDGDRDALAELVQRDAAWIEARVRARRGDALRRFAETDDQFQELVVDLLQFAPRFLTQSRGQFRALLARMIENNLLDRSRKHVRSPTVSFDPSSSRISLDPSLQPSTTPSDLAARNEELAWMRLGIEFLPAELRELIAAHAFDGRTFVELATTRGIGADGLRMRYQRAIVRLSGIVRRLQQGQVESLLQELDE